MPLPTPAPSRPVVGLPLTDREREVLDLCTRRGATRKGVAAALGVSRRQVDRLLLAAFAKLGEDHIGAAGRALGRTERSG